MKLFRAWNLDWSQGRFKVLGIIFSTDVDQIPDLNLKNKKEEIENIFKRWEYRNLTLYGKISIIKTLALAKLVHILSIIPDPGDTYMKEIETCFYKFLWNEKNGNIKRTTMIQDFKNGGLKMIDIRCFAHALKVAWIKRLLCSDGTWQKLARKIIGEDSMPYLFNLDERSLQLFCKSVNNSFWKQTIEKWAKVQKGQNDQVLWKNINIKVKNKPVFY